jgi:hypothetical protein
MSESLQQRLRRYNAKERGALVNHIFGGGEAKPTSTFMKQIAEHCDIDGTPSNLFWAMDFHLDWLYAALANPEPNVPILTNSTSSGTPVVTGSQEDIDFLLCFDGKAPDGTGASTTYLILIEAKGVTSWGTSQMASKHRRFLQMKPMFEAQQNVCIRLLLMSPSNPRIVNAQNSAFSDVIGQLDELFGTVKWIRMEMPEQFYKVVRCTSEGTPTQVSPTHWKIERR